MKEVLATLTVIGVFIVAPVSYGLFFDKPEQVTTPEPICEQEPIPYETIEIESDDMFYGESGVTSPGENGIESICKLDGAITSRETIKQPISEVVTIGTYVEPVEVSDCPVTTCNDGWCSSSTGRGTCSWHGGVRNY